MDTGNVWSEQIQGIRTLYASRLLRFDARFDTQYREQLELTSAEGTSACYVRLEDADVMSDGTLSGGRICLNYIGATGFLPLTVRNGEVVEAAFCGEALRGAQSVEPRAAHELYDLQAVNFAITELGLYLDTHSDDEEAVQLFNQYVEQYEMTPF